MHLHGYYSTCAICMHLILLFSLRSYSKDTLVNLAMSKAYSLQKNLSTHIQLLLCKGYYN